MLTGKTVGLVGIGNIAKKVAKMLKGFDCDILYYDVFQLPEETEKEMGVRFASLEELMSRSDVVSIPLPTAGKHQGDD